MGASRQAGGGTVTIVLVPKENFTFGKGILHVENKRKRSQLYRLVIMYMRVLIKIYTPYILLDKWEVGAAIY